MAVWPTYTPYQSYSLNPPQSDMRFSFPQLAYDSLSWTRSMELNSEDFSYTMTQPHSYRLSPSITRCVSSRNSAPRLSTLLNVCTSIVDNCLTWHPIC